MIVSLICPCRNERAHIAKFLKCIVEQDSKEFLLEVIIADGLSEDGTTEILAAWCAEGPRRFLVSNKARTAASGLNAAIAVATGEVLVRMDVHTEYARDYVAQCVKILTETGATCVGGPWIPRPVSLQQQAIAAAFTSPFGSGNAKSRQRHYTGPTDTVYLGAWRRKDLLKLGGFDEQLARNEDDELCLRIRRSGGLVWQSSAIRSTYMLRKTFRALWGQFFQYGYWRAAVIKKHFRPSSIRQLVPTVFLVIVLVLIAGAAFTPVVGFLAASLLLIYLITASVAAVVASKTFAVASLVSIVVSFACMHLAYGLGLAYGVFEFIVLCRHRGASAMMKLTR